MNDNQINVFKDFKDILRIKILVARYQSFKGIK